MRKLVPFENFPLYGIGRVSKLFKVIQTLNAKGTSNDRAKISISSAQAEHRKHNERDNLRVNTSFEKFFQCRHPFVIA